MQKVPEIVGKKKKIKNESKIWNKIFSKKLRFKNLLNYTITYLNSICLVDLLVGLMF